jgi:hypothetical protein
METVMRKTPGGRRPQISKDRCAICGNRTDGRTDCGRHTAAEKNAVPLRAKSLEWDIDRDGLPDWGDFWY